MARGWVTGLAVLCAAFAITACGSSTPIRTVTVVKTEPVTIASTTPTAPLPKTVQGMGTGPSDLARRPTSIYVSGDGTFGFRGGATVGSKAPIDWTTWTASKASAAAYQWLTRCTPSCAQGKTSIYPVTITLSRPRTIHGQDVFSLMRVRFTGTVAPGFQTSTSYRVEGNGDNYQWSMPASASTTTTPAANSTTQAAPPASNGALTVKDFNGDTLAVTASLIDPAQAASSFDTPQAGTRLIALKLRLTDDGPGQISSDANSDSVVIGSDGQDYDPVFSSITGCTNFNSGDFTLTDGGTQDGCVVFQLPNAVTVSQFQFTLGTNTAQFNH